MRREVVLVDLGNTLIHGPRITEVFKHVILSEDLRVDPSEATKLAHAFDEVYNSLKVVKRKLLIEVSLHTILKITLGKIFAVNGGFIERLREVLIHHYVDTRRTHEDALVFLRELKRNGFTVIVVSNISDHYMALESLRKLSLMSYIDDILTSAQLGIRKPHPLIYLRAMQITSAFNAIFVGDNIETDVIGPERIGLNAIHVFRGGLKLKRSVDSLLQALDIILAGRSKSLMKTQGGVYVLSNSAPWKI
ncbi:MAG: hypothetical protein DRJ60_01200 [Thermoprotei archaeon]|nr:MAG: hypothetical protein DRJ60_01200 [Thermoprotei archaeon]